jgi:hypothetical protein
MSSFFPQGAALYSLNAGVVPGGLNNLLVLATAPTSSTIYGPAGQLLVGQRALVVNDSIWELIGFTSSPTGLSANWVELANSSGEVLSITGTTNQISASSPTGNVTLSLIGPYTPAIYTAHGVLVGEGTGSIVATAVGTAGQYLVSGGAGVDPSFQTATPQLVVTPVAGASQAMTSNHTYIANDSALTTFTLPATSSVGDILQIVGSSLNTGGWKVTYTTSQIIWGPAGSSTVTTGNAASATAAAQVVSMVCTVANDVWVIINNSGTITLT